MNPNITRTVIAKQKWLIATLLLSLLLTFLVLLPSLFDKYQVSKDVQNFYWMARYQDPALFTTDYLHGRQLMTLNILDFQLVLYPVSLGYGLLFYVASFVIDHIWFSKLLVFILMPVSVFYLCKLGRLWGDRVTGVSLSLFFVFFILATDQSISPATGLQRAFALPMLIAFLYYLARRQYGWAGLMNVVAALIYFPVLPLTLLTYGLSLLKFQPGFKLSIALDRDKVWPLLGSLIVSMGLLSLVMGINARWFRPRDVPILQNPAHQAGGAAPMFLSFPWLGRAGIFDSGMDVINFIVLLIAAVLIYRVVGRSSLTAVPAEAWRLLAAGLIMYTASFYVLIGLSSSLLYQPSRYTRTTLFLFILLYVGLNWPTFLEKGPAWFRRRAFSIIFFVTTLTLTLAGIYLLTPARALLPLLVWFAGLILSGLLVIFGSGSIFWMARAWPRLNWSYRLLLPLLLSMVIVSAGAFYIRTLGLRTINPTEAERDIYEFVGTLPKDAVLAGEPTIMSGIPLFSERSVLFRELHPSANPNVSPLILDYFEAQYAQSPQTIIDFCQRYKITHFVLDMTQFTPEYLAQEEFFYQPWNDDIIRIMSGRSDFILPTVQPIFTSDPYWVIECKPETFR